ncbi:hypothetical protein [Franconibacter helveticus]|uniref:hypothetical protein n=1 Tax=Franconibacter helveticus TaxID=357240 RepID=UPI000DA24CAD|nr:hypothetical protein [Franconibacter helveticus]
MADLLKAKIDVTDTIPEASNYFEAKADSVVTIGTNADGEEIVTFIFLNNYPIVAVEENGNLTINGIQKRRVASVTLGKNQAMKFYNSLKDAFNLSNQ